MRHSDKKVARFGVSMEEDLLERFDQILGERGIKNRSEGFRLLVREWIARDGWNHRQGNIAGTITITYHHHQRGLVEELVHIQHRFHSLVLSTTHVHCDPDHCLEVILIRGKTRDASQFIRAIQALRGITGVETAVFSIDTA